MKAVFHGVLFISRVWRFGVNVARSLSCGLAGPGGTPLVWTNAKLTGSVQFGLQFPLTSHSRLSMFSAEHQCVLSQLMLSENGSLLHKSARIKTAWQGFPDHESAKIGSADLARHLAGETILRLEGPPPRGRGPGPPERPGPGPAG